MIEAGRHHHNHKGHEGARRKSAILDSCHQALLLMSGDALAASHVRISCSARDFPSMPDANARHNAEDRYYAALDLMGDGHLEQAVTAYQESIAADPTFTEAMHGLARALQDLQRYDEAIAVSQRIAELDPDDVLAHTSLSVLYQKKGMIPEAEAEGNKARILGWKQQLKKS